MNITFDLETLGNSHQAPIVQIGAVKFTDKGEIVDSFSRNIKIESLAKYSGFTIDYSTLQFWFNQSDEAIKMVMCAEQSITLHAALSDFVNWLAEPDKYVYWSHATFDPPILAYNFRQVGIQNPIFYRLHRDIRTLSHFAGKIEVERKGVAHNALDDCLYQAEYVSKGIQLIRS